MRTTKAKFLKKILVTITCFSLLSGISITAFADSEESDNISTKGTGAPASYELSSETAKLDKAKLISLKKKADKANQQNNVSDTIGLASEILGYINYPMTSETLNGISKMIKSDLDVAGTYSYAFDKYVYLDENPKVKSVNTKFKIKRFFDGYVMHPWYPYGAPTEVKK